MPPCTFCPYPTLERIGGKRDIELAVKILDDVAGGGVEPELFVPARLDEPLLDRRLFELCDYVARKLRSTEIVHFKNGTTLTDRNIDRMMASGEIKYLRVFVNDHRAAEHRAAMGIDYGLVTRSLRRVHDRLARGELTFSVICNRIGDRGGAADVFAHGATRPFRFSRLKFRVCSIGSARSTRPTRVRH